MPDSLEFSDYEKQFVRVSKYILNDNSVLSVSAYQNYLRKLCNYIAKKNSLPEVVVNFRDFEPRADGIEAYAHYRSGKNMVEFNTLYFVKNEFVRGFNLEDIDTVFHEMTHHYQYYNMKRSNSVLNYYSVSDRIIWTSGYVDGNRFYRKNYENISLEWDARLQAALQTEDFFGKVDPSLVEKYKMEIDSKIEEAKNASKKVPSLGFKDRTKILNEIIKNHPMYVSEYPVLKYKYNMDGSIKTKYDIQQSIDHFKKLPESSENDQILTLLNIILEEIK